MQCSTYSCIGVKTAAMRSCNRSVLHFGLNHIWNVYQVLQARNPNKSQKMHDPESPHFVIGSTRNTNSTMLLYWLAQLVGDKTFGILKELRRSFCCCCFLWHLLIQTSAKLLGRLKPCFPKPLCVGITTNQSRCKTIVSIIDSVKMKKILKGHSIEALILLPAGTKN